LQEKEKKLVSYLDVLTLLRGMGMNPTGRDLEELYETMKEPVLKLEEIRREEERKRDKEKEKQQKDKKVEKKPEKKEGDKKDGEKKEGEEGEKKKVATEPPEEIKNIDWNIFITHVEPIYMDNRVEEEEIIAAMRVYDTAGRGMIKRSELIKIMTENGETVLSPAEVKQFMEFFPNEMVEFKEFAQRLQGTYQPPQGPTAEEIEEERRRREKEERERKEAEGLDGLLVS